MIVAGTCDNVHLLLFGQINELHSVTGYTDGEVCVLFFLRMLHSVDKLLLAKHVNIEVMRTLVKNIRP